MYALEFKMEEGDLGKYRITCYSGLREQALTKWCVNADAALAAFAEKFENMETIFVALQRIDNKIEEMNAAKKAAKEVK